MSLYVYNVYKTIEIEWLLMMEEMVVKIGIYSIYKLFLDSISEKSLKRSFLNLNLDEILNFYQSASQSDIKVLLSRDESFHHIIF